jgi:hypothetical protein
MSKLEKSVNFGGVEYDILDVFIPGFSFKHIPEILKEKDNLIRNYEIGIFSLINIAQVGMYGILAYS